MSAPGKSSKYSSSAIKRRDVEIVGRFVEQQNIRLCHQDSQKIKPAPFAARQIADERILRRRREQEFFEHLRSRDLISVGGRNVFGDLFDVINDALFFVQSAAFLIVIADVNGLPDLDLARIGFDSFGDNFQKRRFARTVFADNADAVVAF